MRKYLLTGMLLLLCATLAAAQTTKGSIYGTVRTAEGLTINGVKVTLTAGHIAPVTAMTGDRGTFCFGELPIGEFSLKFEKTDYQTLVLEGVLVSLGAASRLDVVMEPSVTEQVITITGETALVDLKKTGTTTNMTQDMLANIPTARDPWVVLDQVPGLQTDRVNIGGSESGQQSNFVAHGSARDAAAWSVDGVMITDMSATGASPGYYDFDSFDEMQITTSGSDASIPTQGVALNFITKQGGDTIHGQASGYYTGESLQGENIPADLEAEGYAGNKIEFIKDYGFDVGGPVWKGNLWFWGAYRVQDISLITITGAKDKTKLENINLKFTGQAGSRNRWTFFYTRGDKTKSGRNAAWNRPPETTHDQSGPTPIYKIDDTFLATENLILAGKFAYVGGGFQLEPKGGRTRTTPVTFDDGTSMWGGSHTFYETVRPQWQLSISGEQYIDEAFGGSHEIKAGYEYRLTPVTSLSGYGGDMIKTYYYGQPIEITLFSTLDVRYRSLRSSFYLMDIFNYKNFTFNVGLRYDRQWGNNVASTARGNDMVPDIMPTLDYPGDSPQFTWNNFVPRLGMTYDIFGDGKTILRANFSIYADQLGAWVPTWTNPLGLRNLTYEWNDLNNNKSPQANELGELLGWGGLNPFGGEDPLDNGVRIDPGLSAPMTYEFLVGAEREIMPNIAVAGTYIYRRYTNFWWGVDDNWVNDPYEYAGTLTQGGYTMDYYQPTMDHAGTTTVTQTPDYYRVYQGMEVTATKRLSDNWMASASFSYGDVKQYWTSDRGYTDPTAIENFNGRSFAPQTGGSGKTAIFINSRWAFRTSAMYQLPWGVNLAGYFNYREGFVHPIRLYSPNRDHFAGRAYPVAEPIGMNHLPNLTIFDFRVEKTFRVADFGRLGVIMDVFNVFNTASALGKNRNAWQSTFNDTTEITNPRLFRFALRFQF